jgi:hypothetical protein
MADLAAFLNAVGRTTNPAFGHHVRNDTVDSGGNRCLLF